MRQSVSSPTGRPLSRSARPWWVRCATWPRRVTASVQPGQPPVVDIGPEHVVDPPQPVRVEADLPRVGVHLEHVTRPYPRAHRGIIVVDRGVLAGDVEVLRAPRAPPRHARDALARRAPHRGRRRRRGHARAPTPAAWRTRCTTRASNPSSTSCTAARRARTSGRRSSLGDGHGAGLIFHEDMACRAFADPRRLGTRRPVVSLDHLIDEIMVTAKPLPWERLRDARVPLRVVATAVDDLTPHVLEPRTVAEWRAALRATATIPYLAGTRRRAARTAVDRRVGHRAAAAAPGARRRRDARARPAQPHRAPGCGGTTRRRPGRGGRARSTGVAPGLGAMAQQSHRLAPGAAGARRPGAPDAGRAARAGRRTRRGRRGARPHHRPGAGRAGGATGLRRDGRPRPRRRPRPGCCLNTPPVGLRRVP